MLRRTTAALGFGLVFVAFLLQGTGQAASLAPGLARSVVHDPATHASGPAGVGPARPLWPEHFPSLLPAYPIPSQGGGTQTMGASSEEPVEVDPSASSSVADDGPIDGWAHLTTQEKQAAIDRILRSPSSGGFGPISNFSLDIPSLPTSPVTEVELPKIRLKADVSSRADNATPPAVTPAPSDTTRPAGISEATGTTSIPTEGTVGPTSNFSLDISSLPISRVSKASWTTSGELKVTVSMADYEAWQEMVRSYLIDGNTTEGLDGALRFLDSDATTEIGSIDFTGLVPVSLELAPATPNSDQIAEFVVTFESEQMQVSSPDKPDASSGTARAGDSGAPVAGAMAPDVSRTVILGRIRSVISEAQQRGVSDSVIRDTVIEELYNRDGTPRADLPGAFRAIEQRLAIEALLLGGVINPVDTPFAMSGISGGGAYAPLEVIITSTGGSTGKVLDMYVVNNGKAPAQVDFEGMVLEPVAEVTPAQRERIRQVMAAAAAGKDPDELPVALSTASFVPGVGSFLLMSGPSISTWAPRVLPRGPVARAVRQLSVTKVTLDAYCLEYEAGVPTEGVVFRIADRATQEANAPMRSILSASRRLHEQGVLRPDSDPTAYYHSIRQWAIWVDERSLDRSQYEETFVEHTKKNFEAAGQEWSGDIEQLVRDLAPNRWGDIERILDGAVAEIRALLPR